MFLQAISTLLKGQIGTWLHINKQGQMYVWFLSDRAENREREEKGGQIFVIIYLLRSNRKSHFFCAPKPHPFRNMEENVFLLTFIYTHITSLSTFPNLIACVWEERVFI